MQRSLISKHYTRIKFVIVNLQWKKEVSDNLKGRGKLIGKYFSVIVCYFYLRGEQLLKLALYNLEIKLYILEKEIWHNYIRKRWNFRNGLKL